MSDIKLRRLDEYRWEVPREGAMRVPGIIYASDKLMKAMGNDESPKQVANVAQLPGIVKRSLAIPDMHWGYVFPIGGVAAFDLDGGIISPGGVGYDINCGCRLMMTNLRREGAAGAGPIFNTANVYPVFMPAQPTPGRPGGAACATTATDTVAANVVC